MEKESKKLKEFWKFKIKIGEQELQRKPLQIEYKRRIRESQVVMT